VVAAQARQLALGPAVDALGRRLDRARVGRSSAPSRCSSVDLPEPERPTTATSSPARDLDRGAVEHAPAARPLPYVFTRPARRRRSPVTVGDGVNGA
jgi:hypothetical protein